LIFVTVGTTEQPFDRMLKAVDVLDLQEELVVQYGHCTFVPRAARADKFIGFDEVKALIQQARVVVCHAGAGTVLSATCLGKRPVAVPRLKRFGEMVDDHQVDLVDAFEQMGSVIRCMPEDDLGEKINLAGQTDAAVTALRPAPELVAFLKDFVHRGP
jgi:UDP-N-acetylglucosamine transferase subunit ALG13